MADMIDAKEAKQILGCDDETLQNHVNSGAIRAQRSGGKLMLNREDIDKLKEEDGTIVLTGDSDNLSIDLGKVVDDTSETIVTSKKDTNSGESITFGDELEVVNFDDTNTKDLSFEEKQGGAATGGLSFTDSNTAVMTAVDETNVGATTSPVEFHTSRVEEAERQGDSRRSVRSNRARAQVEKVHPAWIVLMALILIVGSFFIVPYYFMSLWPSPPDATKSSWGRTETRRGVQDNGWTSMAGGMAGFSVEPHKDVFKKLHADGEYKDIKELDPQAEWRFEKYRTGMKEKNERRDSFVITEVSPDGKKGYTKAKKEYSIVERPAPGATDIMEEVIDLGDQK
ncbi:MAG: helix-turn-helix domain-containing protein [Planctomycetes bacterium]|nr:helix-turn-helix domain-containing protein [Planctomycetota bacterium]